MKNFQKKNNFKYFLQSKPILFLFGILIVFFTWKMIGFFDKMQDTIKNKKIIEDKILELGRDKEKLTYDITNLNTNKGIEENIREKFGFVKEGEDMILVVDDKNLLEKKEENSERGFFSFFKKLFKSF